MKFRKKLKRWIYSSVPGLAGSFPYFGVRVHFPRRSILFDAVCAEGIYESANLRMIQSFGRDNTTVFDIGANIGLMSVPVLAMRPTIKVVSIEASPHTFSYLERTRTDSRFADRWEVVPKAATRTSGSTRFSVGAARDGAYDSINSTGRAPVERVIEVEATTVDDEWTRIGRPTVSVIKMDVEGAEIDVLEGATACIGNCRPAIVTEWGVRNILAYGRRVDDLLMIARRLSYRIWALPQLAEVTDPTALQVHASLGESFLLFPETAKPEC